MAWSKLIDNADCPGSTSAGDLRGGGAAKGGGRECKERRGES